MLKNPLFIDFSYVIRTDVLDFDCKHIYMWAVNLLVILVPWWGTACFKGKL